jgi:hypothetical protein
VKVVLKTDEYTIFQRRDERYAIKDASKAWINGDAKIALLVENKLVTAAVAKAPEPEPEPEAAPEAEATADSDSESEADSEDSAE